MTKPSFALSSDSRLLAQRLRDLKVGEQITYAELGAVISSPVHGGTPALRTALRMLLRDDDRVFGVMRGIGLRRLNDQEIIAAADTDVVSIRHKARRAARKITAIADYDALSPKDQLAHTLKLSMFAAIGEMATERGMKKLASHATVKGTAKELPIKETLAAFAS